MNFNVERVGKKPMYISLYEKMRDDIIKGVYTYNSKLPSKRLVSEEAKVSVITVEHAYELLSYEGYIEPRERSGYFVIYRADDYLGTPHAEKDESYEHNHISGQTTDFPFSVMAKTMRKVLTDYGEELLLRTPNKGCIRIREVLADYLHRNRGIIIPAERIVIGSGAEYLYGLIAQMMREKTFALEDPSYEKIELIYNANSVKYELLKMGKEGIKSSELADSNAEVLHISPYRSYPSGVMASISKRMEYLRWGEERNRFIIEDDYESEFSVSRKSEETLFSMSKKDNIIYVNSFSMTISPSIRLAYMLLPESLMKIYDKKVGFYSCPVPYFEQLVVAEFIENGDFERHINRVRRKKRKNLLMK